MSGIRGVVSGAAGFTASSTNEQARRYRNIIRKAIRQYVAASNLSNCTDKYIEKTLRHNWKLATDDFESYLYHCMCLEAGIQTPSDSFISEIIKEG